VLYHVIYEDVLLTELPEVKLRFSTPLSRVSFAFKKTTEHVGLTSQWVTPYIGFASNPVVVAPQFIDPNSGDVPPEVLETEARLDLPGSSENGTVSITAAPFTACRLFTYPGQTAQTIRVSLMLAAAEAAYV